MADVEFDGFDGDFGTPIGMGARTARLIGMAGAATSIALVLGLGYWGYRLAVRDMTGIPVVRAMEGPMRVAPEDPGGVIASNQGLSVNAVAEDGGISAPADRLILAPEPVGLTEDDTTVAAATGTDLPANGGMTLDADTDINALADMLAEGSVALSADIGTPAEAAPEPAFNLPKGALAQSPRPRARPSGVVTLARAPVATEITGENLASGTRLVQLGAFDSAEIARKEWDRLAGKFGDLLVGKTRIVQSAKSGGRTFYRLRAAGFDDEADSRRFCSALVAERAACIPVAVR
ncbi:SPOR domain-containing protein (plasmid) [Pseudorhodobacter turbinis]|uniref:SPOR domain-containing protein n=1 Tax=Pseudorhodobacter turbinis TaxID=2500533 RepID=A0A4P8EJE7_9RHOB|nr:SPOR domain-containing protein [Pseudorhodobacter turbinis]QCO56825.1 SPOR domain-containing protein [Pseudorhodobacter turbinis]